MKRKLQITTNDTISKNESNKNSDEKGNEPSAQSNKLGFLENWREVLGIITGITSAVYVIGFIINNTYLGSYGIYDFSLINSRYVYVGAIFLLISYINLYVASEMLTMLAKVFARVKPSLKYTRIWLSIFTVVFYGIASAFASGTVYALLCSFYYDGTGTTNTHFLIPDRSVGIWSGLETLSFALTIWLGKIGYWKKINTFLPVSSSPFVVTLILCILYSTFCYPLLPITIGGGKPIKVQLVIDKQEVDSVRAVIAMQSENISEPVYLLEKGATSYYILDKPDSDKAMQVEVNAVIGIKNLSRLVNPFGAFSPSPSPKSTPSIVIDTPTSAVTPSPTK